MSRPILVVDDRTNEIGLRYEGKDLIDGKTGKPADLRPELASLRNQVAADRALNRIAAAMMGRIR